MTTLDELIDQADEACSCDTDTDPSCQVHGTDPDIRLAVADLAAGVAIGADPAPLAVAVLAVLGAADTIDQAPALIDANKTAAVLRGLIRESLNPTTEGAAS